MTKPKRTSASENDVADPKEKPYVPIEHRLLPGVPEAATLTGLDEKVIRQGKLIACYVHSSTKRIRRRDLDDWLSALPERPR